MISNKLLTPYVLEALSDLSQEGLSNLNAILEKFLNGLMKIEREQAIGASRYKRSEDRRGHCNGFKDKTLTTRSET